MTTILALDMSSTTIGACYHGVPRMPTATVYNRLYRAGARRQGGMGRRDDLPLPELPTVDDDGVLAREGGAVYRVVGSDVYVSIGGSAARVYCRLHNWPQSEAARRIAEPDRHGVALWKPERGEWEWVE